MRVLLVSQFYPPTIGGIEFHVQELARRLVGAGHAVSVATLAGADKAGHRIEGGVDVFRFRGTAERIGSLHSTERRHAPPVPDPGAYRALKSWVREFRPDIVHAHNWLGRSFVPLRNRSGARYVVTLHDCGVTCAQGRMMYRGDEPCVGPATARCLGCAAHVYGPVKGFATYVGNRLMRRPERRAVDAFVPVSSAVAEANELPGAGVRYEVIPNFAADPAEVPRSSDERLSLLPDEPFILQVGDVVPDKGVDVVLAAHAHMDPRPPLVLVGRVSRERAAAAPEGVTMTGSWPRELVIEAWRRSLFGTMPSLCLDASPTVTLEAMGLGKAVVASDRGGLADQVADGETGFLVPAGDVETLRDAMMRLAQNAALRVTMGRAARERFETTFAADAVVARIERLYDSLTTETRRM